MTGWGSVGGAQWSHMGRRGHMTLKQEEEEDGEMMRRRKNEKKNLNSTHILHTYYLYGLCLS